MPRPNTIANNVRRLIDHDPSRTNLDIYHTLLAEGHPFHINMGSIRTIAAEHRRNIGVLPPKRKFRYVSPEQNERLFNIRAKKPKPIKKYKGMTFAEQVADFQKKQQIVQEPPLF